MRRGQGTALCSVVIENQALGILQEATMKRATIATLGCVMVSVIGFTSNAPRYWLAAEASESQVGKREPVFPSIKCVAISPDGTEGLSSCGDTLTLWRLRDGKAIRRHDPIPGKPLLGDIYGDEFRNAPERQLECIAVDWKHRIALTGDGKGMMRAWNLATGALMREVQAYQPNPFWETGPHALAIADDGEQAFSCGEDPDEPAAIKIWSLRTAKQIGTLAKIGPYPKKRAGKVNQSDGPSRKELALQAGNMQRGYQNFILLEGCQRALLAGNTGFLALWDVRTDKPIWKLDDAYSDSNAQLLDATPDGRISVAKGSPNDILVVRNGDGKLVQRIIPDRATAPTIDSPTSVAIVPPDGKRLICGGDQGRIAVWEIGKTQPSHVWEHWPHAPAIVALAVSTNGTKGLVGGQNGRLEYWDLTNGKVIHNLSNTAIQRPRP
jgi:WD40 repeat protein